MNLTGQTDQDHARLPETHSALHVSVNFDRHQSGCQPQNDCSIAGWETHINDYGAPATQPVATDM
jgi:hypothetical protein